MIKVKTQHPYIDGETEREDLILTYAEDENGKRYKIIQVETGIKYGEAVDIYPCQYTYKTTKEPVEVEEEPTGNAVV